MMTVILAALFFGIVIFVHELGHFLVAKAVGVKVERFSLGFGPKVLSYQWGETEYMLSAVPLGGYVKMFGEGGVIEDAGVVDTKLPPEDKPEPPTEKDLSRAFDRQPYWKRFAIIFTGPAFNVIFAFIVYFLLAFTQGEFIMEPVIGQVVANTPAAEAGLMPGDRVTSIGGQPVDNWQAMTELIKASPGREITLLVDRDGSPLEFTATPAPAEARSIFGEAVTIGRLGIVQSGAHFTRAVGMGRAASLAVDQVAMVVDVLVKGVVKMIQRVIPADQIGGPIMIAQIAYKSAEDGPVSYWSIMALISVNLGLLNLLPIPLLDGGHLTIMSIEAVIRRPLNEKLVLASYKVGIALLLTLMLFAFYNDIVRIVTTGWGLPTGFDQ